MYVKCCHFAKVLTYTLLAPIFRMLCDYNCLLRSTLSVNCLFLFYFETNKLLSAVYPLGKIFRFVGVYTCIECDTDSKQNIKHTAVYCCRPFPLEKKVSERVCKRKCRISPGSFVMQMFYNFDLAIELVGCVA